MKLEKTLDKFNMKFLDKHSRYAEPHEDPYFEEYGAGFLPGVRRIWKRLRN
jgi:hypothetical protein